MSRSTSAGVTVSSSAAEDEGNVLTGRGDTAGALAAYRRAITGAMSAEGDEPLTALNLSCALVKAGDAGAGALAAVSAIYLGWHDSALLLKAWHRLASAFVAAGNPACAGWASASALKVCSKSAWLRDFSEFPEQKASDEEACMALIRCTARLLPSDASTPAPSRASGNAAMAKGMYRDAAALYASRLGAWAARGSVAHVLASMTAASVHQKGAGWADLVLPCIAGTALHEPTSRPHIFIVRRLMACEGPAAAVLALAAARRGVNASPDDPRLRTLLAVLETPASVAAASGPPAAHAGELDFVTDRLTAALAAGSELQAHIQKSRATTNSLLELDRLLGKTQVIPQPPNFAAEFAAAVRRGDAAWPPGCDEHTCSLEIESGLEFARACFVAVSNLAFSPAFISEPCDRVGGLIAQDPKLTKELLAWARVPVGAAPGAVRFLPRPDFMTVRNTPGVPPPAIAPTGRFERFYSFVNTPPLPVALRHGSTHVAVGFADLSQVAVFAWQLLGAGRPRTADLTEIVNRLLPGDPGAGPAIWHGLDMSSHSVAKTRVLCAMLLAGAAPSAVAQVWYSSTVSGAAYAAFMAGVAAVLAAPRASAETGAAAAETAAGEARIETLLRHWLGAGAQGLHLAPLLRRHDARDCANFVRLADRLACAAYAVSGAVRFDADPHAFSNPTLVSVPPGYRLEDRECFHLALGCDGIAQRLSDPAIARGMTFFDAAAVQLLEQVAALQTLLVSGAVVVAVSVQRVLPQGLGPARVAALSPATVSWSNLADYFHQAAFFDMARAASRPASAGGTVHAVASMLWRQDVQGGFATDYAELAQRTPLVAAAARAGKADYNRRGLLQLLAWPPYDNATEVVDHSLARQFYERWAAAFLAHAKFNAARGEGPAGAPALSPYSPFCGLVGVVSVSFVTAGKEA